MTLSIVESEPMQLTEPVQARSLAMNENPVAKMIDAVIEKGITQENVATLDKLADFYMKLDAANARKAFAEAKAAMQADLPPVAARKAVPNNDKSIRYVYAPYEDIMATVRPFLTKHGFSISFGQRVEETRLVSICTLTHIHGHAESNEFAVRAGKGPPGANEAQADGAASTYAKRFALCNCLNITIENDQDARVEGARISAEHASMLRRRVVATGGGEDKFLEAAGATTFEDIRAGSVPVLEWMLTQKERAVAAKKKNPPTPAAPTPTPQSETIIPDEQDLTNVEASWNEKKAAKTDAEKVLAGVSPMDENRIRIEEWAEHTKISELSSWWLKQPPAQRTAACTQNHVNNWTDATDEEKRKLALTVALSQLK